ncbi:MAG TPA: TM2 domain-containing protein [Flavisolibacter sp.]
MRKVLFALVAVITLTTSVNAAIVTPGTTEPATLNITKMTVKDVEKMTGKKMNIFQKAGFKIAQKVAAKAPAAEGKSQMIALILVLLVGGLGIHRFYLGYTWQGIVQLLTLGGLGIWALIDLIRIITGSLQPKDGEYATTL